MSSDNLATALLAARRAGELLQAARPLFSEAAVKESIHSVVTPYDLAAQDVAVRSICERSPGAPIVSEELEPSTDSLVAPYWVIDPLDGTSYFIRGLQTFSVSIAYVTAAGVSVGVVFCPATNEMFHAERGGGAFCNGQPIHVSEISVASEAVLSVGHRFIRQLESRPDGVKAVKSVRSIRAGGSCAQELAYLAAGRIDAVITLAQSVWDYAAGMLLVLEACGKLSDRRDMPPLVLNVPPKSQDIIASNGRLHAWCLEHTRDAVKATRGPRRPPSP